MTAPSNGGGTGRLNKPSFVESQTFWLGLYFLFNLGLTLYNKSILIQFPFPYTLTAIHTLCGCIGTCILQARGVFVANQLSHRETFTLGAFSVLYTVNIAISNLSLQLVTVPFHQVVRASTPLFTLALARVLLGVTFTWKKLLTLVPVVIGVTLATYGDYYFTVLGLVLTLLGTFLAALKTVVTNILQSGSGTRLELHPLDLLLRMSPLAFIQCVVYSWLTGELELVRKYGATDMTKGKAVALAMNGFIAFGLNVVSFTANKKAGPLTMTVAANIKQVLTILLAVSVFDLEITLVNLSGILLSLVGGAWYATSVLQEKAGRDRRQS